MAFGQWVQKMADSWAKPKTPRPTKSSKSSPAIPRTPRSSKSRHSEPPLPIRGRPRHKDLNQFFGEEVVTHPHSAPPTGVANSPALRAAVRASVQGAVNRPTPPLPPLRTSQATHPHARQPTQLYSAPPGQQQQQQQQRQQQLTTNSPRSDLPLRNYQVHPVQHHRPARGSVDMVMTDDTGIIPIYLDVDNPTLKTKTPVTPAHELGDVYYALNVIGEAFHHITYAVCGDSALAAYGHRDIVLPTQLTLICPRDSAEVTRCWALASDIRCDSDDCDQYGIPMGQGRYFPMRIKYTDKDTSHYPVVGLGEYGTKVLTLPVLVDQMAKDYISNSVANAGNPYLKSGPTTGLERQILWILEKMQGYEPYSEQSFYLKPMKYIPRPAFWVPFTSKFSRAEALFRGAGFERSRRNPADLVPRKADTKKTAKPSKETAAPAEKARGGTQQQKKKPKVKTSGGAVAQLVSSLSPVKTKHNERKRHGEEPHTSQRHAKKPKETSSSRAKSSSKPSHTATSTGKLHPGKDIAPPTARKHHHRQPSHHQHKYNLRSRDLDAPEMNNIHIIRYV